jgi:Uma2 family endonuclease
MAQAFVQTPSRGRAFEHDNIVVLRNTTWADYQRLLEMRGERAVPRLSFLEGVLELMTPSRTHEVVKSMIGRLVEAWCSEKGTDITAYGSWTIESKDSERGAEPDECYVLGDNPDPIRPDLAIEVIWTSGSIDKLEIYRKLGVREVWVWRNDVIQVHALRGEHYVALEGTELLPGIDLAHLVTFIDITPMTRAVREYRAQLRAKPGT